MSHTAAELLLLKHRGGATGKVRVQFAANLTAFGNLVEGQ